MKRQISASLLITFILLLVSCEDSTESKNEPPEILSLIAEPDTVETGGTSELTCNASDEDGDALSYIWTTSGASTSGIESTVTYTAPTTVGKYTITCTVSDGNGGEDSENVNIVVIDWITGTVSDIDGNEYQTVKIGDQWWMAENLNVVRYRNGDAIPNVTDNTEWWNLSTGAFCEYNNDIINVATYGRLYNWFAVDDSRNIAPTGWHVPTDDEWQILVDFLGGNSTAGGKMKETGTAHWSSPNAGATNSSGFSALPGGHCSFDGSFYNMSTFAEFWSSRESNSSSAWFRALGFDFPVIDRGDNGKKLGFSVRCIRD